MRTLQERLQERMRAVLQRNVSATSQVDGPRIPMVGERYRHIHSWRMVTVTASGSLEVFYLYEFYKEICKLSLEQFDKQFKRVAV